MKKALLLVGIMFTFSGCCKWAGSDPVTRLLHAFCGGKVKDPNKTESWKEDKQHQAFSGQSIPGDDQLLSIDVKSLRSIITHAWDSSQVRDFEDLANFVVVDVRGQERYRDCRIRGSINIALKDLQRDSADWPTSRKIIVYSENENCPLAAKAAKRFVEYGFEKVFVCQGGLSKWLSKGFEYDGSHTLIG